MSKNNVNPVHLNPQNEGNSFTFTSPVSPYQLSTRDYQLAQAEGSSFTFTSPKKSGFQYNLGTAAASAFTEGAGLSSTYTQLVSLTFTEFLGIDDPFSEVPLILTENAGLSSTYTQLVSQSYTELFGVDDPNSFSTPSIVLDLAGLTSIYTQTVSLSYTETMGAADVVSKSAFVSGNCSVKIEGLISYAANNSTKVEIINPMVGQNYSVEIAGLTNTLVGVTATGGTFVSPASGGAPVFQPNTFSPNVSVATNGVQTILIGSPPAAANTAVYVDIPNSNVPNNNWGQMFNFGMGLDYLGGTWSVTSINDVGSLASQFRLFGLTAAITAGGGGNRNIVSNSAKGYVTRGIFGTPKLNKQLSLILGLTGPNSSLPLTTLNLQLSLATVYKANAGIIAYSVRETAQFIANLVGITLQWQTFDSPMQQSFTIQPTMTAISALQSIVSQVGAVLRWTGDTGYIVCSPNYSIGSFVVPNVKLINASGLEYEVLEDLQYGIGGVATPLPFSPNQGIYSIPAPVYTYYNANTIPPSTSGTPAITQIWSTRQAITTSDPPYIVDLPFDYDNLYAQIVINDPNNAGTATFNSGGTYNGSIVVTDPSVWYSFAEGAIFADTHITTVLRGNVYVPIVTIDSTFFPINNPDIAAGNFSFNLGVTRRGLGGLFNANTAVTSRTAQYVKTYQGTINCVFFGVMPLPGMLASAQVDDVIVQGVIESVSFTPPGFLTIQVARYAEVDWLTPWTNVGTQ